MSTLPAATSNRSRAQRGKTHRPNGQGQLLKPKEQDGRTREGRAARAAAKRGASSSM